MHRLKKITVQNFARFYGEHEIELAEGVNFIISRNLDEPETWESNAVGKTMILHAISYALFGMASNKLKGDDLICNQCGPKEWMRVSLEFSGDVSIVRSYYPHRKRSELTFINPHRKVEGDTSVVTKEIAKYFNVSFELFRNALMLTNREDSKSKKFLTAEPADRATVLGDLVDDRVWRRAAELLSADAKELDAEAAASMAKLQVHQRNQQSLEVRLTTIQTSMKTAQAQEKDRLGRLQARRQELRDLIKQETAIELHAPQQDPEKMERARVTLARRLQNETNALREIPSTPPPLAMGVTCPTCQSTVSAETVERVVGIRARAQKSREELKAQIAQTEKELGHVQEWQKKDRERRARVSLAKERRERYKTELAHVESELQERPVSLFALAEEERVLREQLAEQQKEIAGLADEAVAVREKSKMMAQLARGFQSDIRNILFDRIRDDLERFTAAYLRNLAGKNLQVSYPSGLEATREKFDIYVYAEDKLQKLEAYSGGEAWRAGLAILFALRDVLMIKADCNLSLLMIDDPVGPVDPIGLTNLFSALQGFVASKSARTILVTIPNESDATTGNIIRLERKNGVTRVL